MVCKTLLVLANSIKNGQRCMAGREVVWNSRGYVLGQWIRPISKHGEGELDRSEIQRSDGSWVGVLDFAGVRLEGPRRDPCHPEDWVIAGARPWDVPGRPAKQPPLAALTERPADLWLEARGATDRIAHAGLRRVASSICVVRPVGLTLVCWTERNAFERRNQRKFRARFVYNDVKYDVSLTDPDATERYCLPVPELHEGRKTVPLSGANGPLICVSLTPEFKQTGYHYKVVAAVLGM